MIARARTAATRTQFVIFTLFGDYVRPRGGTIWTSALLRLLDVLGVSERAARSTLSRMARKGWLAAYREGRRSQYSLTPRGWTLLDQGEQRIFEPPLDQWDGRWHLVVYSLPESERPLRHVLRRRLTWLGFGHLAAGTWVSPHDRAAELRSLSSELGLGGRIEWFAGTHPGPSSDKGLLRRCWDLPALAAEYRSFVTRYRRGYLEARDREKAASLTPQECFIRRFWLTHDFQPFPLKDPNLPAVLLPADWIGSVARELFRDYRGILTSQADAFVDTIIMGENGGADLAPAHAGASLRAATPAPARRARPGVPSRNDGGPP